MAAGAQRQVQGVEVQLGDLLADRGGPDEDLHDRQHLVAGSGRNQPLGQNGVEGERNVLRRLVTEIFRVKSNHAFHGPERIDGMERGDDQMPGQGGVQSGLQRLPVPDLADDDHIGIFTQGKPQCPDESPAGKGVDLALSDDGSPIGVQILGGILDHQDVPGETAVDVIHHGGQRGGLAGPGGARDQNEPPGYGAELFQ